MAVEFDKLFASYTGNAAANRPGDVDQIPTDHLPTLANVRAMLGSWLYNTYSKMPSPAVAANGLSPLRSFVEHREAGRTLAKPSDDPAHPGLPAQPPGQGVRQRRLVPRVGRLVLAPVARRAQGSGHDRGHKVYYRCLPGRPEAIWIFDANGRYICTAPRYAGSGMHPLIDSARQPKEARRLAGVIELRSSIAKHFTQGVKADQAFAHNVLLSAQRAAAVAGGRFDATAAPPCQPESIRLDAASARRQRHGRRQARRPRAGARTRLAGGCVTFWRLNRRRWTPTAW